MSTTEFLKKIKSGAILGWERHRILPSITGAQGILEGASGTSKLAQAPYYNQFGIKASPDWTGKKVKMMTWEEIGGRKVNVEAEFRWYDSIEESVADHAAFFTNTEWRKNNYKEVVGEKDYRKAARALQNAGYATDSQYANKLIRLIETHGLRAWDEEAFSGSVAPTLAPVSSEGAMITPTTETDVVGRYSIEDLEYKDDLLHSPKGESVIYNPTLNDAYGFQTKSGDVLWIDHVLEVNSEDPQEIMDEAVKYMKENAQPDAQYRVKLKHLPDNISIGDTGMFVDHKFNPPLYIEARILEIVTSISNPENDSVVVGNVREVKSQTDASIRALQKELQDTREKLVDDYFAQKELEVSIQANNGLALIDTGVTHAIELIAEPQNEIKLVANTPYKINLNAPVGANVDTYTLTGELLNNTFTAEFEDVVNPIVVGPEPVIDETLISGIVGDDNNNETVENLQGDKTAVVDNVADFTGLRVKELNFKFYDATGALVHEEDVPVNINSKISHSVFKEGVIFASMAITSKADVTVKGLSFKEPSIFGDGAKTTDLIAHFNFDIPHNYIWTRVSDDDDADLLWNDRNKFNNSNILKITIEDINGDKSTFILTVYDENGNVIAGTSETVKVDKSPDKISAEVEEAILEGERLKQKTEQAYNDAVAEADRLVDEQNEVWQGKMKDYDEQVALIDASAKDAQTKADQALADAGISNNLAQTAKDLATTAKSNASTALSNASQAISDSSGAVSQALSAFNLATQATSNVSTISLKVDDLTGEVALKANQQELNTVKGTVNTHTSDISANAQAIQARLTSTQVNSLVDGKGLAKVTYVDNQINATADSFGVEMTRVEGKIDGLEIGGTNLLKSTSNQLKNFSTSLWYNLVDGGGRSALSTYGLSVGDTITFRVYIKSTAGNGGSARLTLHRADGTYTSDAGNSIQNGQEGYSVVTTTIPSDRTELHVGITNSVNAGVTSSTLQYKEPKLEKGNKATDWTPAPEDTLMQNDFTVFKNSYQTTVDSINTELSKTAKKTDLNGMVTESILATKQFVTAGSMNTTLSNYAQKNNVPTNAQFNTLKNSYDSMVQTIGTNGSKIAQMVMTDSVFQTTVAKQSDVFKNYRVYAMSYSNRNASWAKWSGSRIIKPNGSLAPSNANHLDRSYFLYVINETGSEVHSKVYDVYDNATHATTLANDIKSFTNRQYLIILMGSHAPTPNRTAGGLPQAIYNIGGSPEIFINEDWSNQPAYLLVGKPGLGQGRGYEYFVPASQGGSFDITIPVLNGSTPFIDSSIQAVNSQVTQLADSWALTLKSGNDIKTQINASTSSLRLSSKFIHLNGSSLIDNATIKSAHIDSLNANKITGNTADFNTIRAGVLTTDAVTSTHIKADNAMIDELFGTSALITRLTSKAAFISNIKAISIDVDNITGNTADFISAGFKSLNSQSTINGNAIRIQNSAGEFVEMNNTPELRSDDAGGTAVVLGKGRVQFYDSRGRAKGYVGTDMYTADNYDFGTFLSKGTGIYRFARMIDATETTYAYYTVKAGMTDRVAIIEDMIRRGLLPDGNAQQFVAKSNMLAGLNGWPYLPQGWPTLTAGQQIRYKELTTQTTGDVYEDIWKFGPSQQGDWRVYFLKHARFEGGFTNVSDRRIKHDILPTTIEALPEIDQFDFKEYKMDSDGRHVGLGLIAQEAGILRVADDELEGIDIQKGIMLGLKGVQELHEIIKAQAEEIRELKEIVNQ